MFKITGINLRTGKRVCEYYQYEWLLPSNMLVRGNKKGKWQRIRRLG